MFISYTESTTGTDNLDGTAGNGLVCTGQGDGDGGSRFILRQYGFYAAGSVNYNLRLKDGSGNNRLTIDGGTGVTGNDVVKNADLIVPPGWTVEFSTTSATNGCTAWAELELAGHA